MENKEITFEQIAIEDKLGHSIDTRLVDEAIGKAQRSISLKKTKSGHQYKYVPLSDVLSECYELFDELKLTIKQPQWEDEAGHMELRTIITHTPSGQWVSARMSFPALKGTEKNDCQAIGSIQSYWRRYSLVALLGLGAEDDDGKKADGYQVNTVKENPYINKAQQIQIAQAISANPKLFSQYGNKDWSKIEKSKFDGVLSWAKGEVNS